MTVAVPLLHLLKNLWIVTRARIGWVLAAAVMPFAASHAVVMVARQVGWPERLGLDLLHGAIVVAYLAAVVRVANGDAQGLARFGVALPRLKWPGWGELRAMTVVVVLIGLPAALALHPLVRALEGSLPAAMIPEFIMTTLIGLVIAACRGKRVPTP